MKKTFSKYENIYTRRNYIVSHERCIQKKKMHYEAIYTEVYHINIHFTSKNFEICKILGQNISKYCY